MRKAIILLIVFIFLFTVPCTTVHADSGNTISSKIQLNSPDMKIGAGAGSAAMLIVEKELPDAKLVYFELNEGLEALSQGKIDAYVYDRRQMQIALDNGRKGVKLLGEEMDEKVHIAVAISPVSQIDELTVKINEFIDMLSADGTLDDMYSRWVINGDYNMPTINKAKAPKMKLIIGTTGIVPPYSFYQSDDLCGYDIELAYRFAAYLDAEPVFKVYDYGSIIPAAAAGDVDLIMANLNITPERAQALPFSKDLFTEDIGIMVRSEAGEEPEFTTFDELSGKTVSMITGAPFEELVLSYCPHVAEFTNYSNMADMLLNLKQKRTDAALLNNALAALAVNRNDDLVLFPKALKESVFGIAFYKGSMDRESWKEAYDRIPKETVEQLWKKWTGQDESVKAPIAQDWPGNNGKIVVAACDSLEPMSYMGQDGELMGFDVDIVLHMAKEMDVKVEFIPMEFSAVLAYVQSGKALMGIGSIIVTDERREAVDFVEYYPASFVLVVRKAKASINAESFWDSISNSFEKTFIRENRWKLFVKGVLTTLIITACSIILGTTLGFLVFMLCRKGNVVANGITGVCTRLIQGMPMVVLLMILYYIIFGKVAIDGIIVSIIGFTLTFASSVIGLLRIGVGAVDIGQYEAAYALGYPDHKIFFKIILPQALPHVMNAFKGEVVGLIKATAIVGYIAVQDLTKIGDVVRSRTYDAFFPLIAIAVIYFALEMLFGFCISQIKLSDRNNKKIKMLKGVNLSDNH